MSMGDPYWDREYAAKTAAEEIHPSVDLQQKVILLENQVAELSGFIDTLQKVGIDLQKRVEMLSRRLDTLERKAGVPAMRKLWGITHEAT